MNEKYGDFRDEGEFRTFTTVNGKESFEINIWRLLALEDANRRARAITKATGYSWENWGESYEQALNYLPLRLKDTESSWEQSMIEHSISILEMNYKEYKNFTSPERPLVWGQAVSVKSEKHYHCGSFYIIVPTYLKGGDTHDAELWASRNACKFPESRFSLLRAENDRGENVWNVFSVTSAVNSIRKDRETMREIAAEEGDLPWFERKRNELVLHLYKDGAWAEESWSESDDYIAKYYEVLGIEGLAPSYFFPFRIHLDLEGLDRKIEEAVMAFGDILREDYSYDEWPVSFRKKERTDNYNIYEEHIRLLLDPSLGADASETLRIYLRKAMHDTSGMHN